MGISGFVHGQVKGVTAIQIGRLKKMEKGTIINGGLRPQDYCNSKDKHCLFLPHDIWQAVKGSEFFMSEAPPLSQLNS